MMSADWGEVMGRCFVFWIGKFSGRRFLSCPSSSIELETNWWLFFAETKDLDGNRRGDFSCFTHLGLLTCEMCWIAKPGKIRRPVPTRTLTLAGGFFRSRLSKMDIFHTSTTHISSLTSKMVLTPRIVVCFHPARNEWRDRLMNSTKELIVILKENGGY